MRLRIWLLVCALSLCLYPSYAQEYGDEPSGEESHQSDGEHTEEDHPQGGHGEEYKPSEQILHHILDTHNWEIVGPITIKLPWFFYSSRDGMVFAADEEALLERGYLAYHDHLYPLQSGAESEVRMGEHDHVEFSGGMSFEEFKKASVAEGISVLDLSLTKTSLQMIMVMTLLLVIFIAVANAYKKRGLAAPKGMQSFMEPIIIFIRDEVARPHLRGKATVFMPYLLTLFFFIWFANLFGLMPFNSNIAGNISVTASLAVLTFILTQVNGSKDHWKHIFNTPGVPWWLKFGIPLMPVVEFISLFTKPFALAVRLFANITAGHFMVLGLVSLIFIMGDAGANPAGGWGIMPLSVLFSVVIFLLEMIVAIIQPYIFTLLTAVFIGMAMETHDDHH
jgi:F-type H+-transporting ATPase subunit a